MKKTIGIAIFTGLIVGLILGILLNTVPAISNMIPDGSEGMIIGGIVGGVAAFFSVRKNKT